MRKWLLEMGSACQSLNNFFVTGADRIAREPDVKTLRSLATRLKHQFEEAVLSEDSARSSLAKLDAGINVGNLFVTGIGLAIGKRGWVEGVERFEKIRAGRQHCFGMIMVCVGQDGLPDDVKIVSISELARIQNRDEDEIVQELQQRGKLLFSPDGFLELLDEFIGKLREGKLRLPIPTKQLPTRLAIPQTITVEFLLPFKSVPLLPPGRVTGSKGNG